MAEHLFGMRDTFAADDIASVVVARAASGDVLALEQIVSRYHDDMTRVCVVVCGGDADLARCWPCATSPALTPPSSAAPWG